MKRRLVCLCVSPAASSMHATRVYLPVEETRFATEMRNTVLDRLTRARMTRTNRLIAEDRAAAGAVAPGRVSGWFAWERRRHPAARRAG